MPLTDEVDDVQRLVVAGDAPKPVVRVALNGPPEFADLTLR